MYIESSNAISPLVIALEACDWATELEALPHDCGATAANLKVSEPENLTAVLTVRNTVTAGTINIILTLAGFTS